MKVYYNERAVCSIRINAYIKCKWQTDMIEHLPATSILLDWSGVCACAFCLAFFVVAIQNIAFHFDFNFERLWSLSFARSLAFAVILLWPCTIKHLARSEQCKNENYEFACCFPIAWETFISIWFTAITVVAATDTSFRFFLLISVHSHCQSIASNWNATIKLLWLGKSWLFKFSKLKQKFSCLLFRIDTM